MKLKQLIYQIKPPCSKCPYTLGLVRTLTSPCPQCKINGYRMFNLFGKQALEILPQNGGKQG